MSQLMGIITRLQSLQETAEAAGEPTQRNFEVNGEKICSVKYFEKNQTFELTVYQKGDLFRRTADSLPSDLGV